MKVSEALDTRLTCRAFTPEAPPREVVIEILEKAKRAPSGGNLQPWHVYVVAGQELEDFKKIIAGKLPDNPFGEGTEYNVYPPDLKQPYKARRFKCGEDMYATIDVPREDKAARLKQFARNFEFFGAPVAMFFSIDRTMQEGQWADLGMFIQSVMLLAREYGLDTCPQEAWAIWYKTVGEFVGIPEEQMLFCGMGLGYRDTSAPINTLRTDRAPLEEFVSFRGL